MASTAFWRAARSASAPSLCFPRTSLANSTKLPWLARRASAAMFFRSFSISPRTCVSRASFPACACSCSRNRACRPACSATAAANCARTPCSSGSRPAARLASASSLAPATCSAWRRSRHVSASRRDAASSSERAVSASCAAARSARKWRETTRSTAEPAAAPTPLPAKKAKIKSMAQPRRLTIPLSFSLCSLFVQSKRKIVRSLRLPDWLSSRASNRAGS